VTLELCNITAKLPSEGLCSWPSENRSVAPKGSRGSVWETLRQLRHKSWKNVIP